MAKKEIGGKNKENLDDLKQELDIDFHKITPEELYQRFQTHPDNVNLFFFFFVLFLLIFIFILGSKSRQGKRKSRKRWT